MCVCVCARAYARALCCINCKVINKTYYVNRFYYYLLWKIDFYKDFYITEFHAICFCCYVLIDFYRHFEILRLYNFSACRSLMIYDLIVLCLVKQPDIFENLKNKKMKEIMKACNLNMLNNIDDMADATTLAPSKKNFVKSYFSSSLLLLHFEY